MSRHNREIMLIRHPETVANVESRYCGRCESPVTERGLAQTQWLERVVAAFGPDAVYASPLGRALSTATAIAPDGVTATVLDDLAEIDFGDVEGLRWEDLDAAGIRLDYESGGPLAPGGERGADFDLRVRRAAVEIESGAIRPVVVTHGGVIRRLLSLWLDLPADAMWRIAVPNAVAATFRLAGGTIVLGSLVPPPDDGTR